ncbi:MAG: SitI3 family protein [Chloroflexota bacterium]
MTGSTTFDLEVVTDHSPHEFVTRLFKRVNVRAKIERVGDVDEISTQNFEITVFDGAEDALSCELDIEPNVFIEFRPKPQLRTDVLAIKRLLEAMNQWLHVIDNDFAMIYNGESVMMYRQDCVLYVNTASSGWTPARLSLLTFPYETVEMPSLANTDL